MVCHDRTWNAPAANAVLKVLQMTPSRQSVPILATLNVTRNHLTCLGNKYWITSPTNRGMNTLKPSCSITCRYSSPVPPPPDATGLPNAHLLELRNICSSAGDRKVPSRLPSMTSIVAADWSPPAWPVMTTLLLTVVGITPITTRPTTA